MQRHLFDARNDLKPRAQLARPVLQLPGTIAFARERQRKHRNATKFIVHDRAGRSRRQHGASVVGLCSEALPDSRQSLCGGVWMKRDCDIGVSRSHDRLDGFDFRDLAHALFDWARNELLGALR